MRSHAIFPIGHYAAFSIARIDIRTLYLHFSQNLTMNFNFFIFSFLEYYWETRFVFLEPIILLNLF